MVCTLCHAETDGRDHRCQDRPTCPDGYPLALTSERKSGRSRLCQLCRSRAAQDAARTRRESREALRLRREWTAARA